LWNERKKTIKKQGNDTENESLGREDMERNGTIKMENKINVDYS